MKHLGVLHAAGLIAVRREGRRRWNYLNAVPLQQVYERWVGKFSGHWAGSLLDLARAAEAQDGGSIMSPNMQPGKIAKIVQEIEINAPRSRVWKLMTEQPDRWWSHRFNQDSRVTLEARAGGRFAEDFEGGSALYATIIYAKAPEQIRMIGPMGMKVAVYNYMVLSLEEKNGRTRVTVEHHASGDVSDEITAGYSEGWKTVIGTNLKELAEASV